MVHVTMMVSNLVKLKLESRFVYVCVRSVVLVWDLLYSQDKFGDIISKCNSVGRITQSHATYIQMTYQNILNTAITKWH